MLLDLNNVDRIGTLALLLLEELVQFHYIHCFYQLVSASQFIDIQINECVQIAVLRESFHTERIERAGGISSGRPPLGFGIEPHLCGFERCGHRSRFVLFQAEERSLVRFLGVVADIGERTGFDLTVDILSYWKRALRGMYWFSKATQLRCDTGINQRFNPRESEAMMSAPRK